MFTEKIFVFLWLWFLFLTLCTLSNLVFWITTLITPSLRLRFVLKYLELSDAPPDPEKDRKHLRRFVVNFLRPDGIFILRMVASHAGTILCTELTYSLWLRYRESTKMPRVYDEPPSSAASTIRLPTVAEKLDKSSLTDEPPVESVIPERTDPWVSRGGPLVLGNHRPGRKMDPHPPPPFRPKLTSIGGPPHGAPVITAEELGTSHYV